jgi:hypothetical protein
VDIEELDPSRVARPWVTHFGLAAALALTSDLEGAKAALAESRNLNPEVESLVRFRAYRPWGDPQYWALFEKTAAAGVRQAGFPDQGPLTTSCRDGSSKDELGSSVSAQ